MAMSHTHRGPFAPAHSKRKRSVLWLPIAVFTAGLVCAALWVTWLLWPRWPAADMALDAPSLPITVNGVNFNIPPAAIRNKMQRKPGTQERVDLSYVYPSLEASNLPRHVSVENFDENAQPIDRIFVASVPHLLKPCGDDFPIRGAHGACLSDWWRLTTTFFLVAGSRTLLLRG